MYTIAYGIALFISIAVWIYIAVKNYDKVDPYCYSAYILVPVIVLAYWLKSMVISWEAAMISFCFVYFDSTVLLTILIFAMLRTLGVRTKFWVKFLAYGSAFAHLWLIWMSVHNKMYYGSITVLMTENGSATKMVDGPFKVVHVIYLSLLFIIIAGIIIAAYIRNGTYSRRTLYLYTSAVSFGFMIYVVEQISGSDFSVLPFVYVLSDVFVAVNYDRALAHDISAIISTQQNTHAIRGYIVLDFKKRFLSCNLKAYEFFPELKDQRVDEALIEGTAVARLVYPMIHGYEKQGTTSKRFHIDGITCMGEICHFSVSVNGPKWGYVIDIRDATEEQKVFDLMSSYNDSLNKQVKDATDNIKNIQSKIVAGMANMIENRDDNTGGHVKRTSDIIRFVIEEIRNQGLMSIDEEFAQDIIRAAPMHDLGKIIVENSILNKPGKLTDEEYEIMKMHSTKSGEMVMILLDGVEEEHFVKVAYNVARYHHERWDGRGYPEKLVGTMIPIEARIMAIVDVYDALVSKRSYKEAMSFEKATMIMCEGMGTQFDPNMRSVFLGCKDKLEDYYRNINEGSR